MVVVRHLLARALVAVVVVSGAVALNGAPGESDQQPPQATEPCAEGWSPAAGGCVHDAVERSTLSNVSASTARARATVAARPPAPRALRCHTGGNAIQVYVDTAGRSTAQTRKDIDRARVAVEEANGIFLASSAGRRELRVVTETDAQGRCVAKVDTVNTTLLTLRPGVADTWKILSQVQAVTGKALERKYLLFGDTAAALCGIASSHPSDTVKSVANRNNIGPSYAFIRCWDGYSTAHEITHMLGGVLAGAPDSNGATHCLDEWDVLCYVDETGRQPWVECPNWGVDEWRLDCNSDTYFNPAPEPGTWLAGNWNVADSSFLHGGGAPVNPTRTPPTAPVHAEVADIGPTHLTLTWDAAPSADHYQVLDPRAGRYLQTAKTSLTLTGLEPGRTYRTSVHSVNHAGASLDYRWLTATTSTAGGRVPPAPLTAISPVTSLVAAGVTATRRVWTARVVPQQPHVTWQFQTLTFGRHASTGRSPVTSVNTPTHVAASAPGATVCVRSRTRSDEFGLEVSPWSRYACTVARLDDRQLGRVSGRVTRQGRVTVLAPRAVVSVLQANERLRSVTVTLRTKKGFGTARLFVGRTEVASWNTSRRGTRASFTWRRDDSETPTGAVTLRAGSRRAITVESIQASAR